MKSLAEKLAAKMEQDRIQSETLIQTELKLLEEGLKKQSTAALNSTKRDIDKTTRYFDRQQQQLQTEIKRQMKLLFWMMKLPLLALLIVCLLLCLTIWGYWKLTFPYEVMQIQGRPYQVMKGDFWMNCQIGKSVRPCLRVNQDQSGKT